MSYISPALNFLITTLKKAASPLSRDFNEIEQLQSSLKGLREFSSAAHSRVVSVLRTELGRGKPDYAVVMDDQPRPAGNYFLVAPLDGFANFVHGIPNFAVTVSVVENGVMTAAAIINPATSELFFAGRGSGAFREGFRSYQRLRVSARKELKEALVGLSGTAALPEEIETRRQGAISLDLASVAAGRMDAVLAKECSTAAAAAGILLVKEAGGYVYETAQPDFRSDNWESAAESGNLLAVNAELGKKLLEFCR